MNKLTKSQLRLLKQIREVLQDDTLDINPDLNKFLVTCIDGIVRLNLYSESDKFLLNGLRTLYMDSISQENPKPDESPDELEIW